MKHKHIRLTPRVESKRIVCFSTFSNHLEIKSAFKSRWLGFYHHLSTRQPPAHLGVLHAGDSTSAAAATGKPLLMAGVTDEFVLNQHLVELRARASRARAKREEMERRHDKISLELKIVQDQNWIAVREAEVVQQVEQQHIRLTVFVCSVPRCVHRLNNNTSG